MTRPMFVPGVKCCPKCTAPIVGKFVMEFDGINGYLEYACHSCGYFWETQTADAQPQEWTKGELPKVCGGCKNGPTNPYYSIPCSHAKTAMRMICADTVACIQHFTPRDPDPLPCPWCGVVPEVENYETCGRHRYAVTCGNDDCNCAAATTYFDTAAEAVAAWNKRK